LFCKHTVKASKFGPHGYFEPLVARSMASLDDYARRMNRTELAYLNVFYSFHFLHYFFLGRVLVIASPSEKKIVSSKLA
jgi:hypothetical protein